MLETTVFTIPTVPDDWTVKASKDGQYWEVYAPGNEAAVQISIYRHNGLMLTSHGSAEWMLRRFAEVVPPEGQITVSTPEPEPAEQRAFAWYRNRNPDTGELWQWFAACFVWDRASLVCSSTTPPGDPIMEDCERMITSIVQTRPQPS